MATTTTYASALTTMRTFAINHGFNDADVLAKIDKLIAQKASKRTDAKSKVRLANEGLANELVKLVRAANVDKFTNAWVRDNMNDVATAAKATAVLNAAVDLRLVERHVVAKSATRNELFYTLCC